MKIFNGFDYLTHIPNPVLTIGTFDGVHLGHQKILQQLKKEAASVQGESVLLTFHPHPRVVISPQSHGLKLIQSQDEKIEKLRKRGLDNLIVLPFTMEFSNLPAIEFVEKYLIGLLGVRKVVIGHDHQFGKNREGTIEFLQEMSKKHGFEVIEIPAQEIDEIKISSTKIRTAIESGEIEAATSYLGAPFELQGRVTEGEKLGRTMGFPTANLHIQNELKIIPETGVYCVEIALEDGALHYGMMNIGVRPTVSQQQTRSLEVHIFDFSDLLYGQTILVRFLSRIRDEQKFVSADALMNQLQKDEKNSREFIAATRM
jgi:riboflavin kinase / FMN adenylyltransferase